jgi:hypothetical protein
MGIVIPLPAERAVALFSDPIDYHQREERRCTRMGDVSWIGSILITGLIVAIIAVMIFRYTARIRHQSSNAARRSRLLNELPSELRFRVYARDDYTCQRCGTSQDILVDFVDDPPDDDRIRLQYLTTRCSRCTAIVHQSGIIG